MSTPESGPERRPAVPPIDLWIVRPTLGQGGADRVTVTLLRTLDRGRFRPSLLLMRAEGELLAEVPADVPVTELAARSLWTAWWPLAALLRRRPPDVLLSTSSGANVVALAARRLAPGSYRVVLSERTLLDRGRRSPRRRLLQLLKRLLYGQADCITAVSESVRANLVERLKLDRERVRVVYNPILTDDLARNAAAAVSLPWHADGSPWILAAGRLVPEKAFDLLITAFAGVLEHRPARLLILGEGPLRQELTSLVARLGLQGRVFLHGFDRNPFRYMARCDLFVLSSRFEGLPGVLIQAMACGAAVVATDCPGGPAEVVTPEVDGRLVPAEDEGALTEVILELLRRPELRRRLGAAARRSARRFTAENVLPRYVAALEGTPDPGPLAR